MHLYNPEVVILQNCRWWRYMRNCIDTAWYLEWQAPNLVKRWHPLALIQRQKYKPNSWTTTGTVVSCRRKRNLYAEVKIRKNPVLQKYYKDYGKILTTVINQAKRMTYEKQIRDSTNKIRTTWNIKLEKTIFKHYVLKVKKLLIWKLLWRHLIIILIG